MTRLTRRFEAALAYATQVHHGQVRKKTRIPYVSHLLGVAALVLEDGGSGDEAIAALLHDACEDQPLGSGRDARQRRLDDVRRLYGARVAGIVAGCTETLRTRKPSWGARKRAYLRRLRQETDAGILRVSLADKLHNARAMLSDYRQLGERLWDRFNAGKEDQLWYYRSLVDAFSKNPHATRSRMVGELQRVVSELDRLAQPT